MEDWKSYLTNTEVIVHAGGLSERWYPVTQGKIPKVLTEIGTNPRPIIDWTILPYVKAGIRKFFITLWHQPEKIIEHCNNITKNTGIEFVFLKEEGKRIGRAGVVKYYLEKGILDINKHKIMFGGSDINNLDLEKFAQFHLEGVSKGFLVTLVGSSSGLSQFDKIIFDPSTNQVIKLETERTIALSEGENANTGTAYFDAKINHIFLNIDETQLPLDWENMGSKLFNRARCFKSMKVFDSWIPLKTPYDYKKAKDIDFEKWFGIDSVETYLGEYKPILL
ncbi:MAG: sugar phosphate nucleotidyltransferase [Candidatus Aenigmatarchaeota archaeon]|nr:hypothetical protein [Candidatus Aenigmarchaeota archaeon]